MTEEIQVKLQNDLQAVLRQHWDRIVYFAEYGSSSYLMEYFAKLNGQYRKCYELLEIDDSRLEQRFAEIDEYLYPYWKALSDEERWTSMTICMERNKLPVMTFDYLPFEEHTFAWKTAWKQKNLI